jgi:integrase/recombinase XerD
MTRFEEFLKEKQYLLNVSPRTLEWYSQALHWLPTDNPNERELKNIVVNMRESGLKARSINSYRTAINSYLHWITATDKACSPQCPHPRIPKMKTEQKILPVYSGKDISVFVHWKPKHRCERRLQVIMLMLVTCSPKSAHG